MIYGGAHRQGEKGNCYEDDDRKENETAARVESRSLHDFVRSHTRVQKELGNRPICGSLVPQ